MCEVSVCHSLVALAPVEELLCVVKVLVLQPRSASLGEGIVAVICPSSRKVLTESAVIHALVGIHSNLVAIIQLRCTTKSEKKRKCLLVSRDVICHLLGLLESVRIVIGEEREEVIGIGINHVLTKIGIEFCETVVPFVCLFIHDTREEVHKWEVHHSLQL